MTKRTELYKCEICGNIVEIHHHGASALVCCNEKMQLLVENETDGAVEKHIPIIEKLNNGYKISVGEVEHPMTEKHYIEWIQLITENQVYTKFLEPDMKPEAIFEIDSTIVNARAYCNLHGNWKNN